ncbi:MAG: hypothetical protein HC913_11690 [Microscillaceae bacterium]|nr:hypothetical protein [Microscillaceae bacterium]
MYWIKTTCWLIAFALLILALPVCTGNQEAGKALDSPQKIAKADSAEAPTEKPKPLPTDRKFNDMAQFIAGLPAEEGSSFASYSQNPAWQQYAKVADTQWNSILNTKLPKIIQWRDQELKAANAQGGLLFYPFSGPDFLHASAFFPEADTMVLVGLEPIGNLPDFEKIAQKSLQGYFNGLQQTLNSILNFSFFRTNSMAVDFTGKVVSTIDGTLPVLMLFMARTGHKVLYYEKIAISPKGKIIPAAEAKADSTYFGTMLAYSSEKEPENRKTLFYFAANLQDTPYSANSGLSEGGLLQRSDFRKYLESLPIQTTYIKSASYLMYRDEFSIVRNLILNKSTFFLQDDSGMPIRFLDRAKWDLTFYGSYVSPISLFQVRYQADLRAIYQKGEGVRPLPFGIGYQFREGTSNLMLATKK